MCCVIADSPLPPGSDCRIMPQISSIVDRTMASIRNDMSATQGNDTPTTQSQSQLSQLPGGPLRQDIYNPTIQASARSESNTPSSMVNGTDLESVHRTATIGNPSYYDAPIVTSDAVYPQLGYADLSQPTAPTSRTSTHSIHSSYMNATDQNPHQYMYATGAAASAAAAQMSHHNTPDNSPVSATHNPMVPYSTPSVAAPTSHSHSTTGGDWVTPTGHGITSVQPHASQGGNPWHEWANAIALVDPSSQDRFSANALLTLNAGHGGPGGTSGAGLGIGGPEVEVAVTGVPSDHAGQWPMLIYNPNVSGT